MASSFSSTIHRRFNYDVFFSFCPSGDEHPFVDHLYAAFEREGVIVYKDDDRIKKDQVIGCSKISIIVFSKDYLSSSRCLEELAKIMEFYNTTEHEVYPVFYDVERYQVLDQRVSVGEAFYKHEMEELAVWELREALAIAAILSGWEFKSTADDGSDALAIKRFVEYISRELRITYPPPCSDNILIGMETRLQDLESSLAMGLNDVHMIGIKGMEGSGKTTLAKAIFYRVCFQFERTSFVENVRQVSKTFLSYLTKLQEKILSEMIFYSRGIKVNSVTAGKQRVKRMLCHSKVLLVLDDVDCVDQLEALAGSLDWFV